MYALKPAQDVADLKASSLKLTRVSLTTTDSIDRVLAENDVGDRIYSLGKNGSQPDASRKSTPAQLDQLRELLVGMR